MMLKAIVACAALMTTPAMAANCPFVSAEGQTMAFLEDGENTVEITESDGDTTMCTWMRTDRGTGNVLACDDGSDGFYSFSSWPKDAGTRDLMSYRDLIWYSACAK